MKKGGLENENVNPFFFSLKNPLNSSYLPSSMIPLFCANFHCMWAMWEDERHAENDFFLAHTQYYTSLNDMKVNKFLSASCDRLETSFSDDVADVRPFLFLGVILIRASELTSFVMLTVCWWDLWRVSLMLSWWEEFTQDVTYGKVTKMRIQTLHSPLSCPSDPQLTDCSSSISSRQVLHFLHSESAAHHLGKFWRETEFSIKWAATSTTLSTLSAVTTDSR